MNKSTLETVISHAKRHKAVTGRMEYGEPIAKGEALTVTEDALLYGKVIDGIMYNKTVRDWKHKTPSEIIMAFTTQDFERFKPGELLGM